MSYYKAVFNLYRPIEVKAPEERAIYNLMSGNPFFATDPPVPYADFLIALNEQDTAEENAQFGGQERIELMRTKEKVVDDMVRKYRTFVTLKADGDTNIILSSGFKHTKPRESAGTMAKVEGVKRLNTDISGELKLRWKPIKNVGFYDVQIRPLSDGPSPTPPEPTPPNPVASGQDNIDEGWIPYSTSPASILISGLPTLIYYAIRVRAKGAQGYGGFSDALVVLVI